MLQTVASQALPPTYSALLVSTWCDFKSLVGPDPVAWTGYCSYLVIGCWLWNVAHFDTSSYIICLCVTWTAHLFSWSWFCLLISWCMMTSSMASLVSHGFWLNFTGLLIAWSEVPQGNLQLGPHLWSLYPVYGRPKHRPFSSLLLSLLHSGLVGSEVQSISYKNAWYTWLFIIMNKAPSQGTCNLIRYL